jgi:hypothetical protein
VSALTRRPVRSRDKPAVRWLVQLYIDDLGGACGDVEPSGTYDLTMIVHRFETACVPRRRVRAAS